MKSVASWFAFFGLISLLVCSVCTAAPEEFEDLKSQENHRFVSALPQISSITSKSGQQFLVPSMKLHEVFDQCRSICSKRQKFNTDRQSGCGCFIVDVLAVHRVTGRAALLTISGDLVVVDIKHLDDASDVNFRSVTQIRRLPTTISRRRPTTVTQLRRFPSTINGQRPITVTQRRKLPSTIRPRRQTN